MRQRALLVKDEAGVMGALRALRGKGLRLVEVHSPYPLHHLEEELGREPSRLTWACFGFGAAGALGMLLLQQWTSAVSWPLNVGGKPFNSLPAFIPVVFEGMVLCAGLGLVASFFYIDKLRPWKAPAAPSVRCSDDRFAVIFEDSRGTTTAAEDSRLLKELGGESFVDGES